MGDDEDESLVSIATETFGEALQSVIRYRTVDGRPNASVLYARDDAGADDRPAPGEIAADLARDYAFEAIERDWHEGVHRAGRFRASVRLFERAAEIRLHRTETAGCSIVVDPGALSTLTEFFSAVERRLGADGTQPGA